MRRILSLLMIVFLLVSLPACSLLPGAQNFQQSAGQNDNDNEDSDDADEDDEEEDADDNDNNSDNDSGGSMAVGTDWPKDLAAVPEFTYGNIITVLSMTETYEGIDFNDYSITFENADKDAAEDYAADLEKAGFELVYEPYESEDGDYIQYEYEMYAFETDDTLFYVSVDFWVGSDDTGAVYVSIPENPGPNGAQSDSSSDDDGSYEVEYDDGESEFNWGTLSESDIPEGYPHSDVPLYGVEDGVLLGASKQEMGGEGTAYIIVFGVNEDVESVSEMIGSQLEQYITSNGGTFQAIMGQMFMGEVNNCSYTVAVGDGSADGYTAVVDYTVIVT